MSELDSTTSTMNCLTVGLSITSNRVVTTSHDIAFFTQTKKAESEFVFTLATAFAFAHALVDFIVFIATARSRRQQFFKT